MNHRKDDLIGIRKARFASFALLLICFMAMLVIFIVLSGRVQIYIASGIVIVCLVVLWWVLYRRILFEESAVFQTFAYDIRGVHRRLRMFESAVRQIGDGVIIVANEGDLVFLNETARRLFAAYDSGIDADRYDEYASGFSPLLERGKILDAAQEGRFAETISVDGRFYRIGYTSLVPEDDKKRGAVAVISDVTTHVKADNMQSDFVANVSHELKTPLASVKSYAETLMAGADEDEKTRHEFLGIIVSEADRMDRLVKDLMFLARLDYPEESESTNAEESELSSLVKMSMKKLDMAAREKKISVNQMFSDKLSISIEMNRDRIEQVLMNILGNAIKYTDEKGRIDVDIISAQNCVQIVISDNGVGIPEKDLTRVFERFFRVDKARTGKHGGTGLGLAISKQIVGAHGGDIGIESKCGRGATVTVTLPTSRVRGTPGIL